MSHTTEAYTELFQRLQDEFDYPPESAALVANDILVEFDGSIEAWDEYRQYEENQDRLVERYLEDMEERQEQDRDWFYPI